jgi:hypothetical protein
VLAAAAAIAAIAILGRPGPVTTPDTPSRVEPVGTVFSVTGTAELVERSGTRTPLGAGAAVPSPAGIVSGASSFAAVGLTGGHALRIGGETMVRFDGATTVTLERGVIYLDGGSDGAQGDVTVGTRFGEVRELGTRFEVRVDDAALRVRLRDGRVTIRTAERTHVVTDPSEVTVAADGRVTSKAFPAYGPEWDTWLAAAAVPEFDGRRLQELLAWVARERGLRLVFADPRAQELATSTDLHGSLSGLGPQGALDAAVRASGMECRVDRSTLRVRVAGRGKTRG